MQNNIMKVYGIMGPSGSGKSFICNKLEFVGGYIIDADKVGHSLLKKGQTVYYDIVKNFDGILDIDNNIDRKKLGKIVFENEKELKKLNEIVHPHIFSEIEERVISIKAANEHKFIVIDAAILIEIGLNKLCDKVILITADEKIRIDRIIKRDNTTKELAKNRVLSQKSFLEWAKLSDLVFINNDDFDVDIMQILV